MSRPFSTEELREQQLHEHDELVHMVAEIDELLAQKAVPAAAAKRIEALQLALNSHFSYEENHGLFRQVIDHAPRLAAHAGALQAEHHRLRGRLQHVLDLVLAASGRHGNLAEARSEFGGFRGELADHEHAEHALLYNAFEQDIGDKD